MEEREVSECRGRRIHPEFLYSKEANEKSNRKLISSLIEGLNSFVRQKGEKAVLLRNQCVQYRRLRMEQKVSSEVRGYCRK